MSLLTKAVNFVVTTLTTNIPKTIYKQCTNLFHSAKIQRSTISLSAMSLGGTGGVALVLLVPGIQLYFINATDAILFAGESTAAVISAIIGAWGFSSIAHNISKEFYKPYSKKFNGDTNARYTINYEITKAIFDQNRWYFQNEHSDIGFLTDTLKDILSRFRSLDKNDITGERFELKTILQQALYYKNIAPLIKYYAENLAYRETYVQLFATTCKHIDPNYDLSNEYDFHNDYSSDNDDENDDSSESIDYDIEDNNSTEQQTDSFDNESDLESGNAKVFPNIQKCLSETRPAGKMHTLYYYVSTKRPLENDKVDELVNSLRRSIRVQRAKILEDSGHISTNENILAQEPFKTLTARR